MSVSRRDMVKGLAWSVPVIAVAAAVPAMAASQLVPWVLYIRLDRGRQPANNGIDELYVTVGLEPEQNPGVPYGFPVDVTFTLDPDYYTGEAWTADNFTPSSGTGLTITGQTPPIPQSGSSAQVVLRLPVVPEWSGMTLPSGVVSAYGTAPQIENDVMASL